MFVPGDKHARQRNVLELARVGELVFYREPAFLRPTSSNPVVTLGSSQPRLPSSHADSPRTHNVLFRQSLRLFERVGGADPVTQGLPGSRQGQVTIEHDFDIS